MGVFLNQVRNLVCMMEIGIDLILVLGDLVEVMIIKGILGTKILEKIFLDQVGGGRREENLRGDFRGGYGGRVEISGMTILKM